MAVSSKFQGNLFVPKCVLPPQITLKGLNNSHMAGLTRTTYWATKHGFGVSVGLLVKFSQFS